jgi:thymidylate synthase
MVSAWNPADLEASVLPPCHYGFQVYTRELKLGERKKLANYDSEFVSPMTVESWDRNNIPTRAISLIYNARSQDVPLGTPFNISSYALLLEIIAKMTNMVPDELIANMGDCHIYLNQIDGVKEQLKREPYALPKLVISSKVNFNKGIDEFSDSCSISDFKIEDYQSHPTIKIPLSN